MTVASLGPTSASVTHWTPSLNQVSAKSMVVCIPCIHVAYVRLFATYACSAIHARAIPSVYRNPKCLTSACGFVWCRLRLWRRLAGQRSHRPVSMAVTRRARIRGRLHRVSINGRTAGRSEYSFQAALDGRLRGRRPRKRCVRMRSYSRTCSLV